MHSCVKGKGGLGANPKGDRWELRCTGGRWSRKHNTWRRCLLTPCKVPKGSRGPDALHSCRITEGIMQNGGYFRIVDDWTAGESAHRQLPIPWLGTTRCVEKEVPKD